MSIQNHLLSHLHSGMGVCNYCNDWTYPKFHSFLGFLIHTAHSMRAIIRVYNHGGALFHNALSHTICVDVSVVSRLFSDTEVPGLSSNLRDHIPA